jgi:hypothetical protein
VNVRPVAFDVCCLPDDHPERYSFALKVVSRDLAGGMWAVLDRADRCLSVAGEWEYEHIPSERTDEWKATHRFTKSRALELATEWAPKMTIGPRDSAFIVDDMMQPDPWAARAERLGK